MRWPSAAGADSTYSRLAGGGPNGTCVRAEAGPDRLWVAGDCNKTCVAPCVKRGCAAPKREEEGGTPAE